MHISMVKTGSVEMEYFSFGTGEKTLVILPGIDVKSVIPSAKAVERAYGVFAEDYTVYVFDRRRNMPETYSVREMASDTAAVMRALGLSHACVFGASHGGMIAQYLAIDAPDLVGALALGSTASRRNAVLDESVRRWTELAEQGDVEGLTGDFIDRLYSEKTVGRFRDFLIHMNDNVTVENLKRFLIQAASIAHFDAYSELSAVRCPALVIGVSGDKAVSEEASFELAEKLGCELVMYPDDYGHCVFDEADDYKTLLLGFFDRCERGE